MTPTAEQITYGALFAGFGGLERGLESVFGGVVRWVSDIDPGPSRILAYRYPDAPNLGDITAVQWGDVDPVTILTGGSPCQDLSHAGSRAGDATGHPLRPVAVDGRSHRDPTTPPRGVGERERCSQCVRT